VFLVGGDEVDQGAGRASRSGDRRAKDVAEAARADLLARRNVGGEFLPASDEPEARLVDSAAPVLLRRETIGPDPDREKQVALPWRGDQIGLRECAGSIRLWAGPPLRL
jgi:hypothetical protein